MAAENSALFILNSNNSQYDCLYYIFNICSISDAASYRLQSVCPNRLIFQKRLPCSHFKTALLSKKILLKELINQIFKIIEISLIWPIQFGLSFWVITNIVCFRYVNEG